jgi:hypothetical protein
MSTWAADAIEHYQAQLPRMKSEFDRRRRGLRERFHKQDNLYSPDYVRALFDLAEDEVRLRTACASECLAVQIQAGWLPSEDDLETAYVGCFNALDHLLRSFDDVEAIIDDAIGDLGRKHDPDLTLRFQQRISDTQLATSKEHKSDLRAKLKIARVAKTFSAAAPIIHTTEFHGATTIGALQQGGHNVANVEQTQGVGPPPNSLTNRAYQLGLDIEAFVKARRDARPSTTPEEEWAKSTAVEFDRLFAPRYLDTRRSLRDVFPKSACLFDSTELKFPRNEHDYLEIAARLVRLADQLSALDRRR